MPAPSAPLRLPRTGRNASVGGRGWSLVLALLLVALAPGCAGPAGDGTASMAVDLRGRPVDPFRGAGPGPVVLVFLSNDCPIANRYAPELRRLREHFGARGVRFFWVHPVADETPESIRRHASEYGLPGDRLRDPGHVLVRQAGARVTPEAAVFNPDGRLLYHGRIDDRFVALGRERPEATRRDLADALEAVLAGRSPVVAETRAVGCHIPDP